MGNEQVHLRLDAQTKQRYDSVLDKFKDTDPNLTVNDVMSKVLDIVEVNIAKTSTLVSSKEMKELDHHANRMSKIYANIIQRAEALEAKDKNRIQALEHKIETDTKEFKEIISNKNEVIQNLKNSKIELDNTLIKKEEYIKEISDHFDSNKDLIQNLEKQLIDYEETIALNKKLESELKDLNKSLVDTQNDLLQKNSTIDNQDDKIESLTTNYKKCRSKIEAHENRVEKLKETITNLEKEMTDLKIKYSSISAKYDSTLKENAFYEKQIEIIRSERTKDNQKTEK